MAARVTPMAAERTTARTRTGFRPVLYGVAILIALLFVVPFLWTISISLKQIKELFQFPPLLFPEVPQWGNYLEGVDPCSVRSMGG